MNKAQEVILLKGAPGSGKTQTAKCLSQFFPNGVRMEVDKIRQMVISVDWTNQEEHIKMLDASLGLVFGFLNLGLSPIIVVDTFSGDKVNRYIKLLLKESNDVRVHVFGLIVSNEELERRLELRTMEQFKDLQICKKLNNDAQEFKHSNEYQINTTGRTASETAQIIYNKILTSEFSLGVSKFD